MDLQIQDLFIKPGDKEAFSAFRDDRFIFLQLKIALLTIIPPILSVKQRRHPIIFAPFSHIHPVRLFSAVIANHFMNPNWFK